MKTHGWSTHGAPCCGQAPLPGRPDHVTACGGADGGCPSCLLAQLRAHHEMPEHSYLFDEGEYSFNESRWGSDWHLMMYGYVGASIVRPFSIITNGA